MWGFLPVLFDVVSTSSFTLTLSPRAGLLYASGTFSSNDSPLVASSGVHALYGGGVGAKLRLGDNFAIMPEFAAFKVVSTDGVVFQGGISCQF